MPKVKKEVKAPVQAAEAPKQMWKGKPLEEAKSGLIARIREGMPSVSEIKTQGFGVLRKHREWEKRVRPLIDELEQIEGRPVAIERYRPGR